MKLSSDSVIKRMFEDEGDDSDDDNSSPRRPLSGTPSKPSLRAGTSAAADSDEEDPSKKRRLDLLLAKAGAIVNDGAPGQQSQTQSLTQSLTQSQPTPKLSTGSGGAGTSAGKVSSFTDRVLKSLESDGDDDGGASAAAHGARGKAVVVKVCSSECMWSSAAREPCSFPGVTQCYLCCGSVPWQPEPAAKKVRVARGTSAKGSAVDSDADDALSVADGSQSDASKTGRPKRAAASKKRPLSPVYSGSEVSPDDDSDASLSSDSSAEYIIAPRAR
jgi:hypothetical protein